MKLILVTGIKRSGSTWQFNVIRLALESAGYSVHSCWISNHDPTKKADYHLIKTHKYQEDYQKKAFKIFTSIREFDGIKKSLKRVKIFKSDRQVIELFNEWFKWAICADYIMGYSDMEADKLSQAKIIINKLGIDVNAKEIIKKVDDLKSPKTGTFKYVHDSLNLLHPEHRSDKK